MDVSKKFAVFDIDGTLIRWQLYHALVDRLAKQGLLGPHAHQQVHEARMKWKLRQHDESFHQYESELISIYQAALPNLKTNQVDAAVAEIIKEYGDQTYTYTRQLVRQLKKDDYILLAISGSHQELVSQLAKRYGFDDCLGSLYKRRADRFTGEVSVVSLDKRAALNLLIKKHHLELAGSVGIGDTGSDISILEMVEQPIAFNPNQELLKVARQRKWPVVVERKNVIYKLEPRDGLYVLA